MNKRKKNTMEGWKRQKRLNISLKEKERKEVCSDDLESDTTTLLAKQAYFHINNPFRTFKVMNN